MKSRREDSGEGRSPDGRLAKALARRTRIGRDAERGATSFLKRRKYRILETNYRCRYGEIDIIALDGETLVFVEVRARTSEVYGTPEESVNLRKQQRISMCALNYVSQRGLDEVEARFDVVVARNVVRRIRYELFRNAFDLACEV